MHPIGIAVIGAGPWGLTLTGAFARLPEADVRWICELDDERRQRAGAVHPDARLTGDADEALRDPAVKAVVVAVDPARHHPVAMRALEAGKHLFVEKPLALTVNDAQALHAAAGARSLVLAVGHLLLHHPAIRCARQMVAQGVLGEPFDLTTNRATPGPPRKPASAWWALAPHDVSLALHLFGELPAVVSATGDAWGRAQEDNAATALLKFSGGRRARVHVARFAPGKRRDMTITGPQASLTFDELAAPDQALRLSAAPRTTVAVPVPARDTLLVQCREFVKSRRAWRHGRWQRRARGRRRSGAGSRRAIDARARSAARRCPRPAGPSRLPDPASSFEAA